MEPDPRHMALVRELSSANPQQRWEAFAELNTAGETAAPAILVGMSHADWRVRRGCAIFVDHHPVPELMERLRLSLYDPKAKVRMWAVHSLSCEPCKPGGNPIDPVPLIVRRLREDKAPRVRRMAALMLGQQPRERRTERALRWAIANDTDEKVVRYAAWSLRRVTSQPRP